MAKGLIAGILLLFVTSFANQTKRGFHTTPPPIDSIEYYKIQANIYLSLAKLRVDSFTARLKKEPEILNSQ